MNKFMNKLSQKNRKTKGNSKILLRKQYSKLCYLTRKRLGDHVDKKTVRLIVHFRSPMMTRITKSLKVYLKIIYTGVEPQDLVQSYINLYESLAINEGPLQAVKTLKSVESLCKRYCCSHRFEQLPYRKCLPDGLPLMIDFLRDMLRGNLKQRKGALFVLQLYKLILVPAEWPSLDPITSRDPNLHPSSQYYDGNRGYIRKLVNLQKGGLFQNTTNLDLLRLEGAWNTALEQLFPKRLQSKRFDSLIRSCRLHTSTRNGPNGQALWTIPVDYKSLPIELKNVVRDLAELLDHKDLIAILDHFQNHPCQDQIDSLQKDQPVHSRLSLKTEPGGKGRIFAIADFFSQSVLLGIHQQMFKFLKSFQEDGTFDQDRVAQIAKSWTEADNVELASQDLKNATDLIPSISMAEILNQMYGKKLSTLWFTLMTDRSFYSPVSEHPIKYGRGQPMGLLSSFASLGLWHHVIYHTILILIKTYDGVPGDTELTNLLFIIIGDDSASKGRAIKELYLKILTILKVPTSPLKGYTSETYVPEMNPLDQEGFRPGQHQCVEIAKRIFIDGRELTTVSPVLVQEAMRNTSDFQSLLRELERREEITSSEVSSILPILCSETFKPLDTITSITFPLWPAPLLKGSGGMEWKDHKGKSIDLPWFTKDYDTSYLSELTQVYLRKQLTDSIDIFHERLNQFKLEKFGDRIEMRKWGFPTSLLKFPFELIQEQFWKDFLSIVWSPDEQSNRIYAGLVEGSEIERNLSQCLRIIFDLNVLLDKPENREKAWYKYQDNFPIKVYRTIKQQLATAQ